MKKQKPLILVTNDDGITAPGIRALIDMVKPLGEVVVVAPDSPQSAKGHAITIHTLLRLDRVHAFEDVEAWQCSGTPADCVKLAIDKVLTRKPDLLVSGINHGSNSSINVIYSGTMSAAVEGAIDGINSVGFSLCDYDFDADFTDAKQIVSTIAKKTLEKGLPYGTLLNVNIPKKREEPLKGIKVCRQAIAKWKEDFYERLDPTKRKYYWLTGEFISMDEGEDTDEWALANNYVSVVPVQFDLTAHHSMSLINDWKLND